MIKKKKKKIKLFSIPYFSEKLKKSRKNHLQRFHYFITFFIVIPIYIYQNFIIFMGCELNKNSYLVSLQDMNNAQYNQYTGIIYMNEV